jgi:hypothetical protein
MHPETADCVKACAAIGGIVILESVAMITGHNGTVLRLSIAAIAGLGGFVLGRLWKKRKEIRNAVEETA